MDSKTTEKLRSIAQTVHPEIHSGDKLKLHMKIKEGSKERIQIFEGFVISTSGSGLDKNFTIRKISSGVGVERIIPLNSPALVKIEVIAKGDVKKSKLYYMRDRIGKASMKVKGKVPMIEKELTVIAEPAVEEVVEETEPVAKADDEK